MEHSEITFIPLLVVIALAFSVPLLLSHFKQFGIPIVVGEIIAGIIVGKSGLNIVQAGTVLRILAELGFAYLMFLSGLEIDFAAVLNHDSDQPGFSLGQLVDNPLLIGAMLFGLTLVGSLGAGFFFQSQNLIGDPWLMALILSTTSLGVVLPVLKERGMTGNRYGQTLLVSSLVADFTSILLISVYVLLRSQGLTLEILLVLVLFAVFVVAYRIAALYREHLPAKHFIEELSSATSQIKLRGSFVLALVFIALAESLGIEVILGAFMAGVIAALLSRGEETILRQKLDAIGYGFFIPIFFVMVGVNFDLPALLSSQRAIFLIPILIGTAYAVKLVPAFLFRVKYGWPETWSAGVILSARLSLIIAAAAIGLELGVISSAVNSAIILIALITCTLSPILFNQLLPQPDDEPDRVIVIGSRPAAGPLTGRLSDHGFEAVHLNGDNHSNRSWSQLALLDRLRQAEIDRTQVVVAVEEKDEDNLRICRIARHTFGVANIIAWVQDPTQNDRFRRLRSRVVNPAYSTVLILESMVVNPDIYSIAPDMDEAQEVRDVKLQNPHLVDRRLHDLMLPGDTAVLMIERGGNALVPDQKTRLRANDTLTLVGPKAEVDEAVRYLARNGRS
jgi:Kef-type K+ transport system membrane component KefB/Trk K+ transport system NAD-binding subunit